MKHAQRFTIYTSLFILLVLPVMMVGPFFSNNRPKLHCIPVVFPGKEGYGGFNCTAIPPIRNFKVYTITSDTIQNKVVLARIRTDLNAIKEQRDTVTGIDIRISDDAPFQAFITCVDICKEHRPGIFANCGNDMYAMYVDLRRTVPPTPSSLMVY